MIENVLPVVMVLSALVTVVSVVLGSRSFLLYLACRRQEAEAGSSEEDEEPAGMRLLQAGLLQRIFGPIARYFRPTDEHELAGLRLKLAQAGLSTQGAVELYNLVQAICIILALALAIPWLFVGDFGLLLLGLAACTLVGVLLPRLWLSLRTSGRREKIAHSLSSTLDLLVTCMEAGLGLEQALDRVSSELKHSEPEMAEELKLTIHEMRAGIPVAEAFRKLALRVGLEEMYMLCSVIIQSAALGASIGQMLRQYAASWRSQRMMDLEEKAGKMTAALTLPLTLCLLPSAILAMLGPAVITVLQNLG
jgi:tight adherence protein C